MNVRCRYLAQLSRDVREEPRLAMYGRSPEGLYLSILHGHLHKHLLMTGGECRKGLRGHLRGDDVQASTASVASWVGTLYNFSTNLEVPLESTWPPSPTGTVSARSHYYQEWQLPKLKDAKKLIASSVDM